MHFFNYLRYLYLKIQYHFILHGRLLKLIDYRMQLKDDYIFKMSDDGQIAVLSIPTYSLSTSENVGSIWIFIKNNQWHLLRQITPKTIEDNLYFGSGIDISSDGKLIAVSMPNQQPSTLQVNDETTPRYQSTSYLTLGTGSVTIFDQFVYQKRDGSWHLDYKFHDKLQSTDYDSKSGFGRNLVFSPNGNYLAVAVPKALMFGIRVGEIAIYHWDAHGYRLVMKIRGQLGFSNFGMDMHFSSNNDRLFCKYRNQSGKVIKAVFPFQTEDVQENLCE